MYDAAHTMSACVVTIIVTFCFIVRSCVYTRRQERSRDSTYTRVSNGFYLINEKAIFLARADVLTLLVYFSLVIAFD